jgi:hypothetical protein
MMTPIPASTLRQQRSRRPLRTRRRQVAVTLLINIVLLPGASSVARTSPFLLGRCLPAAAAIPSHLRRRLRNESNSLENSFRLIDTALKERDTLYDDIVKTQNVSSKTTTSEEKDELSDHLEESSLSDDSSQTANQTGQTRNAFTRRVQRGTGDFISALGFVASSTTALLFDRNQFQRLRPSVQALRNFLKTSGIDLEISRTLNARLLDNIVILGRIQGTLMQGSKDRRDLALSTNTNMDLPTEEESLR